MDVKIFYDKECPFCSNYVEYRRVVNSGYRLTLTDMRTVDRETVELFHTNKINMNNGVVVLLENGDFLQAGEALWFLSQLVATKKFSLWKLLDKITGNKKRALFIYPVLFKTRRILLKILRKNPNVETFR
jgi:predicted DCC family thiol-disulfide oxidoreductase YuxK